MTMSVIAYGSKTAPSAGDILAQVQVTSGPGIPSQSRTFLIEVNAGPSAKNSDLNNFFVEITDGAVTQSGPIFTRWSGETLYGMIELKGIVSDYKMVTVKVPAAGSSNVKYAARIVANWDSF